MTERMASGWMTVWRLIQGAGDLRKDAAKMVEATAYNPAITAEVKKCKSRR